MKRTGKKTVVSGILAFSLVLAGTGYAYWTDSLNITTKATTGDLDVTFVDLGLYAQYNNEKINNGWSIVDGIDKGFAPDDFFQRNTEYNKIAKDGSIEAYGKRAEGYNNVKFDAKLVDAQNIKKQVGPYTTATHGSDNIKLTIEKMYPGYAQAFRSDILNVGEIAAKLGSMKFTIEGAENDNIKNMLGLAIYMNQESRKDGTEPDVFKLVKSLSANEDDFFTVGKVDFLRLSALEKLKPEEISKVIENATILSTPTQNRMDIILGVAMDPDKAGKYTSGSSANITAVDDALTQNKAVSISIDFLWDQFNAGTDEGNGNFLIHQNKR